MTANVLFLVRTWGIGGTHTLVRVLLRNLTERGYTILVAGYESADAADEEFLDILRQEGHKVLPERVPWKSALSWYEARTAVARLIARYGVQLVHTHDNLSNLIVAYTKVPPACARVASAYGWFEPKANVSLVSAPGWFSPLARRKLLLYFWIDLNLSLPRFDRVYTVSNAMKKKLVTAGRTAANRIRVIYTGVEPDHFSSDDRREAVRRGFGLPDNAIVVGTVSRLSGEKGHVVLLEAAHQLKEVVPDLRLLIIGRGYMREHIERRAAELNITDRVVLAGFYEDLPGALAAMDIFALPSLLDEGLPTSVLEAQAAGLPAVASDIGGTCETLEPGVTGLLVPPNDPAALAKAIAELAHDPARRRSMGEKGRDRIRHCFATNRMIDEIEAVYRESMLESR